MGSPHTKARSAASHLGSCNSHELFKKTGSSWRFKGSGNAFGTIVAESLSTAAACHRARLIAVQIQSSSDGVRLTFHKGRIAMG
jgi:hypothetical protein